MERQDQARTVRADRPEGKTPERKPGRREEPLTQVGALARAALEGTSLLEAPPRTLEELAGRVGNTAMTALLAAQWPQPEETALTIPPGEPGTVPLSVPVMEPTLVQPGGLLAGAPGG